MAINCFRIVPINAQGSDFAPGAYCPIDSENLRNVKDGRVMIFWQEYAGLCLYEWENNGRDDSDFYMMVWDAEKKQPFPICFATTRGWTYPAYGSKPDATPEVRAEYEAYKVRVEAEKNVLWRRTKASMLREFHAKELSLTARYGFTLKALRNWKKSEHPNQFDKAFRLLLSTKLRSDFKKSLQKQIADWLKNPKYKSPLSIKQWEYL